MRRKYEKSAQAIPSDISLFCNNCITGCVCHDFGMRFNSPTVNLIIKPTDYVEFLSKIEYYKDCEVKEYPEGFSEYSCPVGILDNKVRIYFLHYNSFEEAKNKWENRCKRINLQNMYFVLSEKDGCSLSDLEKFDNLKNCRKKIAFVHKSYDEIQDIFVVSPDQNNKNEAITLTDWIGWFGKREYDVFNWIGWLTNK